LPGTPLLAESARQRLDTLLVHLHLQSVVGARKQTRELLPQRGTFINTAIWVEQVRETKVSLLVPDGKSQAQHLLCLAWLKRKSDAEKQKRKRSGNSRK
jgi:hypothetical protein